tara:strand:- start:5 stop:556 length:552 start_codon:yes stop_codon:yes gene_type:complete
MGIIGKDFKYKKVNNFLEDNERELIFYTCKLRHEGNMKFFDIDFNKNGDSGFYGDNYMESLLMLKLPLMEKLTGKELWPTYSYWRAYTHLADLAKHEDRESCEISVTVNIGGDGTDWPIYIDDNEILLKPGDAAIYLGMELSHYRKEFLGDFQFQTFLHYVDKNGPYKNFKFDKRPKIGGIKV